MKKIILLILCIIVLISGALAEDSATVSVNGVGEHVTVTLTMEDDRILRVEATTDNTEADERGRESLELIPSAMIAQNSVNVDAVSGATCTSNAVIAGATEAWLQIMTDRMSQEEWMMETGSSHGDTQSITEEIPIKVLILPKFEIGELSGDFPGEAQFYYEHYLEGGDVYEVSGDNLYVKDGVALYLTGMGKVNGALSTMAVLSDSRFDFSDACIISTGCAGSSVGNTVMGDVFIITAAVDFDLGHHADARELADPDANTWFHDSSYDDSAVIQLNTELVNRVYSLVKDVPLETTEKTVNYMRAAFNDEAWAVRNPQVSLGTTVTSDNYWKGIHDHENALLMIQTYDCSDPYVTAEMEEIGVCTAVQRMGMLDRLIIIRDSVNMDVFMCGSTPESLWDPDFQTPLSNEDSVEAADIFATAMENNFKVGSVIIDSILEEELSAAA